MLRADGNYDPNAVSRETSVVCGPSEFAAKQSFAEECDINTIVRRFGVGVPLPENVRPPQYGDFTNAMDYRQCMDALNAANESFMAMPADVRKRFSNDPAEFVDFCSYPANLEEMRKLGLAVPAKPEGTPSDGASTVSP